MIKSWIHAFFILLFTPMAMAAAPFDSISLQGYLKTSSGVPVNGTFNGKVTLLQNSAPCWNTGVALVPFVISTGAFSKTLSGGISSGACAGALGSSQFLVTAPFTWTLELDIDANGSVETTFSNIPITAVPFAMVAETISGTISPANISGGTFGAIDGSALTNLSAGNISSGTITPARLGSGTANATTFLRGDNSWQTLAAVGETNTASTVGAGSPVFKQKVGVDLEFRSLLAGSTKLTLTTNTNDISFDVVDANLALSGSQVSGGTFGAVDGTNLTNLPAPNLVGTLPALDGAALTNLNGTNVATGTVAAARLPQAGAAADGIVTTGAQTIAGAKTFSGAVTLSSALTNAGTTALGKADVATAATITCLASTTSVVRLTGTTITSLQGISPGADGQILIVYTDGNIGTGLTVAHNNAGGCVNGRIFTATNANLVSTTATSTAAFIFIYNLASLRWHLISSLP